MIKFFRKIRQTLLAENKFSKYLMYAIGEIILVVIGILIAVGINSRYNDARNEKKIITILTQVQKELITDITDAKRIYNTFIANDSLSRKIMNDSLTIELLLKNPNTIFFRNRYVSFSIKKGGYERLMQNLENLPEKYESLLPHFNTLYVEMKNDIDDFNTSIKETVVNDFRNILNTDPEANKYYRPILSEESANSVVNDPFLKNKTCQYINDMGNIAQAANDFRIESIVLYKKIDSLLGNQTNEYPESLMILPKKDDINAYLGDYKKVSGPFEIHEFSVGIEKEQLIARFSNNSLNVYWHCGAYYFEKESNKIHHLYTNKKSQHIIETTDGVIKSIFINKKDL